MKLKKVLLSLFIAITICVFASPSIFAAAIPVEENATYSKVTTCETTYSYSFVGAKGIDYQMCSIAGVDIHDLNSLIDFNLRAGFNSNGYYFDFGLYGKSVTKNTANRIYKTVYSLAQVKDSSSNTFGFRNLICNYNNTGFDAGWNFKFHNRTFNSNYLRYQFAGSSSYDGFYEYTETSSLIVALAFNTSQTGTYKISTISYGYVEFQLTYSCKFEDVYIPVGNYGDDSEDAIHDDENIEDDSVAIDDEECPL